METNKIYHGDCLQSMKLLPDNSVDSIVTDPPYGLSFMGKKRDYDVPSQAIWEECLRVLKPGGYLLAFAGTRTQHRMAVRIEDAGFEIRDMIAWVYGSGFPKSLNIGKAVDKLQGNERILAGRYTDPNGVEYRQTGNRKNFTAGNSDKVENCSDDRFLLTKGTSEREGRGTALKPALEPITVARKPLAEKTVAENVLKYGTGGINIDESRVGTDESLARPFGNAGIGVQQLGKIPRGTITGEGLTGRFPANLIHDNSEEVRECFPETKSGKLKSDCYEKDRENDSMFAGGENFTHKGYDADSGNASRFFKSIAYYPKASKSERNIGKAVDKLQGNEREKILVPSKAGNSIRRGEGEQGSTYGDAHGGFTDIGKGTSEWEGWGTALKPSLEPITVARKPLSEKTVAENVLNWGTGGINIDESRVKAGEDHIKNATRHTNKIYRGGFNDSPINSDASPLGRFPANLIHDNSEEVRECFPETGKGGFPKLTKEFTGESNITLRGAEEREERINLDSGNASRFFKSIIYQAKASKSERNKGCEELDKGCNHPTVKPVALMEYLIKMVTKEGGIVLDPFTGSGTTLVAAKKNGYKYIGYELTEEYIPIIEARLNAVKEDNKLFDI